MKYQSVFYFPERVWILMEAGINQTLELALALLPIFLLLRFAQDYTQSCLDEALALSALINALLQGLLLLGLLLSYKEILTLLDSFTHHLMDLLGDQEGLKDYLQKCDNSWQALKKNNPLTWWIQGAISWLVKALIRCFSWVNLFTIRVALMHIRGYLLLFSSQVGPLAIAASLLPGKLGGTVHTWFKIHLSFLCWGITTVIIDRTLAGIQLLPGSALASLHDLITHLVLTLLYLFVGPLTSIYLGSTLGNSFFSATMGTYAGVLLEPAARRAHRFVSQTRQKR